ncbi:MAG TPA: hypothetical protein VED40_16880 [Azospirillaceae bacterium]|nr:hypothetical protein [Azospirillaceae bacterium]
MGWRLLRAALWVGGLSILGIFAFLFLSVYLFASRGLSRTDLDRAFEVAFVEAAARRIPETGDMEPDVGGFLEPLLGFRPLVFCQVGGFDFGGVASEKTLEAYTPFPSAPRSIAAFENAGNDHAAPDSKVVLHFIDGDGTAHARSAHWNDSDCQTGASRCAPVGELSLVRLGGGGVVFRHRIWSDCPLHITG